MSYESEVLADSPDLYWRVGESSGTNAADDSGNSHDGTYTNGVTLGTPGLVDGSLDTAITLDQSLNQFVVQNDTFGPGVLSAFTIEAIVKPASLPGFSVIGGFNGTDYSFIELSLLDDGEVDFEADSISSGWFFDSPAGTVVAGQRYHIVGTWDGTTAKIYVNGTMVASQASSEIIELGQAVNFYAGSDQFNDPYDGVLDEIAFYQTALSDTRIAVHYAAMLNAAIITNITPQFGSIAGGTTVTITGAGLSFAGATDVFFGDTPAASFVIVDANTITAVSPAHAVGTVDIIVNVFGNPSALSTADQFTFLDVPTVTAINPLSGSAAGGTSVAIAGTSFVSVSDVLFGATSAASFVVTDPANITAVSPAHAVGTVDITVVTSEGASATSVADQFIFIPAAPFVFNQFKSHMLLGTNWPTLAVQAALFDSGTWNPDPDDDVVANLSVAGAIEVSTGGYARQTVTGLTVTLDDSNARVLVGSDDITFPAMDAAVNYDKLLLFAFVTDDSDSWLIAVFDLGSQTTDGDDVACTPDTDGLFEIL